MFCKEQNISKLHQMNGINFVEWFFLDIFMQNWSKKLCWGDPFYSANGHSKQEIKAEFLPRNKNLFTPGFTSLSKWL